MAKDPKCPYCGFQLEETEMEKIYECPMCGATFKYDGEKIVPYKKEESYGIK